ncbi:MAG: 3-deoxy-D-manno-octulosonic acid transferase [Bacteroidota bacterium]
MTLLYKLAISVYHILIWLSAPFNGKARLYVSGRRNWQVKLNRQVDMNARYIWIHCASLGEFEQGRPLIEAIRNEVPEYKIVLTFFSPSGYEIRKKYPFADIISYLPADNRKNAKRFLDIIKPEKVIFIKYEFWYHYITELQRRSIPVFLASGIFRKNQVFFSRLPWGKWFRRILNGFTHFYLQDDESARLLSDFGIKKFTVCGDTRFDRVAAIAKSAKEIPIVDKFTRNKPVLVAGSTWKPDEELLARFINENDQIKYIIAPHEVTPENVSKLEQLLKTPSVRYSMANESDIHQYQVIIIDSIGLLSSLYSYAKTAYIGGGFGAGIHNILEAATFGVPVIFGPNYTKFREARDMVRAKAAFPVHGYEELYKELTGLLGNTEELEAASERAADYVKQNRGATRKIMDHIFVKQDRLF